MEWSSAAARGATPITNKKKRRKWNSIPILCWLALPQRMEWIELIKKERKRKTNQLFHFFWLASERQPSKEWKNWRACRGAFGSLGWAPLVCFSLSAPLIPFHSINCRSRRENKPIPLFFFNLISLLICLSWFIHKFIHQFNKSKECWRAGLVFSLGLLPCGCAAHNQPQIQSIPALPLLSALYWIAHSSQFICRLGPIALQFQFILNQSSH